jgi:type II secretory pathway pseudopilin PulG
MMFRGTDKTWAVSRNKLPNSRRTDCQSVRTVPDGLAIRPAGKRARRGGMLLVAALVCIAVAIMLAAVLAKATLLQHRQADLASCEQQSFWLAESAVQRAIHNVHISPDYAGETWDVPAEMLGSNSAGVVIIQVTKTSEPQAGWQVHVESHYPATTINSVMCERTLFVAQFANP